nr:TPM domain-containing protein [Rhodoferax sp.]
MRVGLPLTRSRIATVTVAVLALVLGGWFAYGAWAARHPVEPPAPLTALLVNETPLKRYDRALLASIRIFQRATGIGLAVVLQDKLPPGQTIESQAAAFFQQYGLGKGSQGKAMLLLWSEAERQFKIEVSYSLEAVFPDLLCHQLEQAARSYMLASNPYARRDFLTELMVTMRLHYLAARAADASADLTMSALASAYGLSAHVSGGAGIVGRDYASALEKAQALQTALPSHLANDFTPQGAAADTVKLYLRSLREGVGAPMLPLLSEGSRYYRMEKPLAPAYAQRLAQFYDHAMPFTVWQQGDKAVAVFQAGQPVLPMFLRRNAQGRWLVDEPKGQAYFVLPEQGGAAVQKYANFPYAAAFVPATGQPVTAALYADRSVPPALSEDGSAVKRQVQALQDRLATQPDDVDATLKLAEHLHFDLYWLEAAAPLYERVLQLAPDRNDIRWRLLDVYTGTSDIDAQERLYQELTRRTPHDALVAHYFAWFRSMYPPLTPP